MSGMGTPQQDEARKQHIAELNMMIKQLKAELNDVRNS